MPDQTRTHRPTALETVDPEILDRVASSRRDALRRFGGALAVASVPVAFAAGARAAFAQGGGGLPQEVVDVLNFALTLERLEATYYAEALDAQGLIPQRTRVVFESIREHEDEHVAFLEEALGDNADEAPELDFTAGGAFSPFENYQQFLLLSQAFEDTGQRAYRGAAPALAGTPDVLQQALTIHSIEARHAARVRLIRDQQGWIPRDQPGAPEAVAAVYAGMDEVEKYGVDLSEVTEFDRNQITEAFDEPLTMEAVLEIVQPFVGGG